MLLPFISTPLTIENSFKVIISGPQDTLNINHLVKSKKSCALTASKYSLKKSNEPYLIFKIG
ncbi:hypothetical protein oki361_24300 [Helicobacter pylori]